LISDDRQLVTRAQQGDLAAFEALVIRHERYVYNLALRVVANPDEAEELAQLAFVKAWQGLPRFKGQAKFSTWLYRIVTNLCYNRLPRLKKDLLMLVPDEEALNLPDARQEVEPSVISGELRKHLHQAMRELPGSYRLLISLRHLQEMSYEEIALVTGMPLGTVKTGIFRARRLLRQALEEYELDIRNEVEYAAA
jgi:RNA polymerase sigma-70 factor (ECF subfamily)